MAIKSVLGCIGRVSVAIAALALIESGGAKAVLTYEIVEQGGDVLVTASGSLSGLPSSFSCYSNNQDSLFDPSGDILVLGHNALTSNINYCAYSPSSVVGSLGAGSSVSMSASSTGVVSGLYGAALILPDPYVEGSSLANSFTIAGTTLSALGLSATSGLLMTWDFGSDQLQVWAGPAPTAAVPGPAPLLGAIAAYSASRRLRSRLRQTR